MKLRRSASVVIACAAFASASAAVRDTSADTVVYTSRASFEASPEVGGVFSEENFSDSTLNVGLSFTSNTGEAAISGGRFNDRFDLGEQTTFHFATAIDAFGANFDLTPGGAGLGIRLYADGVLIGQQVPNTYSGQFFGFTSTIAFDEVRLTGGTQSSGIETYNLDNLVYSPASSPAPVPLPAAAWGGLALMGLVGAKRLRGREPRG